MSQTLETEKYICGICEGEFEKGQSDEEAMLESNGLFGELKPENAMTVCDECFNEMWPQAYAETN